MIGFAALVGAIACIGSSMIEKTPSAPAYGSLISSTHQLVSGQRTNAALSSPSTPSEPHDLLAMNSQIELTEAASNIIVGDDHSAALFRGSLLPSSILTGGGHNKILAGPNGDIINAGPGVNNEIFIPDDDKGTTIVVSPGSETITGGGPRDQLVVPVDRLWRSDAGVQTAESVSLQSDEVKLVGGRRLAGEATTASVVGRREIKQIWYGAELARYGTSVTYSMLGDGDLLVEIKAARPQHAGSPITTATSSAGASPSIELWTAKVLLKDFHIGDFGLDFSARAPESNSNATSVRTPAYDDAYSPDPISSPYINDNASIPWNDKFASADGARVPLPNPSDAQLNADRKALENLHRGGGAPQLSAPHAPQIFAITDQETSITVRFPVSAVDSRGAFSIAIVDAPSMGKATLNADDTFTFDPRGAFSKLGIGSSQTVTFTYQVKDIAKRRMSNIATVTITVGNRAAGESTVADFLAGKAALDWEKGGSFIADTAASVAANFATLDAAGPIAAIRLTDGGTPALILTADPLARDRTVLRTITNTEYVVSVSDTAKNVADNLDYLNAIRRLASISLVDSKTPTLVLTAAKTLGDARALGKITEQSYAIAVIDWSKNIAPNIAALAANAHVTSLAPFASHLTLTARETLDNMRLFTSLRGKVDIVDTAANVVANYAALAASSSVKLISITDSVGHILPNLAALKKNSTRILVTASDTAGNIVANAAALKGDVPFTVVVDTAANVVANASALSKIAPPPLINIADSAANIGKMIDALNGITHIRTIVLTDSRAPTLTLTAKQLLSDRNAIREIKTANYDIAISDTAANVSANFDALNADNQVAAITLTDAGTPKLKLKVIQTLGDTYFRFDAFAKIRNSNYAVSVVDSESAIATRIDMLDRNAKISSIVLNDGSALTLPAREALNDTKALGKISNAGFSVRVSDTASNVLSEVKALIANKKVTAITVTDSAANIAANYAALRANSLVKSIAVHDKVENILSNQTALVNKVEAIHVRDSIAAVLANTTALRRLTALKSVTVDDTIENVVANLDTLNANALVTSIDALGRPVLNLTAEYAAKDSRALAKMTERPNVVVRDTAENVMANLGGLDANAYISSITMTGAGQLTLTVRQALASRNVFAKLVNSAYEIVVRDSAANILKYYSTTSSAKSFMQTSVSDTTANILSNFQSLQAHGMSPSSITAIDTAANVLAKETALADEAAHIRVVDTAANVVDNAVALSKVTPPASIAVADTAANVAAHFDALNSNAQISAITLTDVGAPILKFPATLLADSVGTINKVTNRTFVVGVNSRTGAVDAVVIYGVAGDLGRLWRIWVFAQRYQPQADLSGVTF